MRKIYIHRGLWTMKPQKIHMIIGAVSSAVVTLFLVLGVQYLWNFQTNIIQKLLTFAKVPYRITAIPFINLKQGLPIYYHPSGNIFVIPLKYQVLSPLPAIMMVALLIVTGIIIYWVRSVPLPFKVLSLFILTLVISTILYTSFVSVMPPHTINRLAIDWQFSGAIILLLISIIFTFAVFPIKGPLWVKFFWLALTMIYAIIWNTVRISVVLSSLYHLGSTVFLLTHYLTGIYIDFIYIVAFYSLALAHLARINSSEVGW